MKYHISVHISPYEIDNYQTFIHQLRRNLNYTEGCDIIFTPMLNLSPYFYNWNKSTLSKDFFIDKFKSLNDIVSSKCNLFEFINEEEKILGAFSYKTMFLKEFKNKVDAFIWFDSDMIFPDNTISSLISAYESVEDKHCIITPQIHRLWDETWDVLVNEDYMGVKASHANYFGFDSYSLFKIKDRDLSVIKNENRFKFGAGWCNLLSSDLFKDYIDFTYNLGHYGPDDTFIMYLLDYYKFNKNKNINQYIIKNLVITENYKYSINPYDTLIEKNQNIKSKKDFTNEVTTEINKVINKVYKQ